jgi:hypothetical protein
VDWKTIRLAESGQTYIVVSCEVCWFLDPRAADASTGIVGSCRRTAPFPTHHGEFSRATHWRLVRAADYCGEGEPN